MTNTANVPTKPSHLHNQIKQTKKQHDQILTSEQTNKQARKHRNRQGKQANTQSTETDREQQHKLTEVEIFRDFPFAEFDISVISVEAHDVVGKLASEFLIYCR